MPDGDQFQWKLRGKGWRKLHKLLTSGADVDIVSSHAIKASVHYLNEHVETPYGDYIDLVHRSLASRSMFDANQGQTLDDSTRVSVALENLAERCDFSESSLLAQRAASRTFARLKLDSVRVERKVVAEVFVGELAGEISERRCLALVRQDIALKCGRTFEEQMIFEKTLRCEISTMAKGLAQNVATPESPSMRSPHRPRREPPRLDQPLPIIPEGR